jgi:hypothetical protein
MRPRGGVAISVLAGLVPLVAPLITPLAARAHLGHDVARAERYLKLDVAGNTARVVVSLTLGPAEGARLLQAADADGDGAVSDVERDGYLAAWGRALTGELPIEVDGERQTVSWGEPYFEPVGPVRALPVTVEMVARVELTGGRQTIRVTDGMVRREVYDRTDVAFRARDQARLVASGTDASPSEPIADLAYLPGTIGGEPVVLTAVVETPERPGEVSWRLWLSGALVLALVIGLTFWKVRTGRYSSRQRVDEAGSDTGTG